MISPKTLLTDLQRWVIKFENDLRQRCKEVPELDATLKADWQKARDGKRTAEAYEVWRDGQLTQSAVGWVLGCVFVRFLEDNRLLDQPWIAGAGDRRTEAEHVRDAYFREHPALSDRDYLQHVFTEVGRLPGMADLFDPRHNLLWRAGISGDAAAEFIAFWRKMDHDFTDPAWDTRFLGDLYQDLSKYAKKTFALLQTPEFVEEFILDRTLEPAIERFGYEQARMIDPTCGSGHFVLGGFRRLLRHWQQGHPEMNEREIARNALAGVAGVDINPFAVAIARFRLLLAAWKTCAITRLRSAPDFHVNLAVGDSLLHGRRFRELEDDVGAQRTFDTEELFRDELKHHYEVEDIEDLHRILGQPYHAVVGNPPYITVKDKALSELYRARYASCKGKYSLSVPFLERFFDLAVKGNGATHQSAGFVGQITGNAFMRREFGKKLIEEYLPRWDVTHVVDTSGAYIPGHGTPTVIVFGKNQQPVAPTIRTVMRKKGEQVTPIDPAQGSVWTAMIHQVDHPGSEGEFVSTSDVPRERFKVHPWSLGGGGASELREVIQEQCDETLEDFVDRERNKPIIGFGAVMGEDEAFTFRSRSTHMTNIPPTYVKPLIEGDGIRDWSISWESEAVFPYDEKIKIVVEPTLIRLSWRLRVLLESRVVFGGETYRQAGKAYWGYHQIPVKRNQADRLLAFASVATGNQFVVCEIRCLFPQASPIVMLKPSCTRKDYLDMLGLLNSSAGGFWMKQVFHDKGGGGIGGGLATENWEHFYAFDGAKLKEFPIPAHRPTQLPAALVQTSTTLQSHSPAATLSAWTDPEGEPLVTRLASARDQAKVLRQKLIAWQEELDWQIYEAYGLVEAENEVSVAEGLAMDVIPPEGIALGERAFEIVLARRMAAGEAQTTWFARHGSTPITELPRHWPAEYRALVERRIQRIENDSNIRLIEQPEYKRRWNTESWDKQLKGALRQWLLCRLETAFLGGERISEGGSNTVSAAVRSGFAPSREPRLCSTRELADALSHDPAFMQAAALYRERDDFDLSKLVQELVEDESVPFLPVQRYKDSGLRKRQVWERTWDLQRQEDEGEAQVRKDPANQGLNEEKLKPLIQAEQKGRVGDIPVPPKYASADFKKAHWWKLRGKLDVPKERWVLYPGAETSNDTSPVIAWAGWDPKQQAEALAGYYEERKNTDSGSPERLAPLLAGLKDLLPWIKQWHNDVDPAFQLRMGDFYEDFLRDEIHALGMSESDVEKIRIGGTE